MVATVVGRTLFFFGWFVFFSIFAIEAFAEEISVFGVRKELSLTSEVSHVKDYYLSGGLTAGIRMGSRMVVVRRMPMHDPSTSRPYGDVQLPVAVLKVIYVDKTVSIARVEKSLLGKEQPIVEFPAVMIGDTVQLEESGKNAELFKKAPKTSKLDRENTQQEYEKADFSSKSPEEPVQPREPSPPMGPLI